MLDISYICVYKLILRKYSSMYSITKHEIEIDCRDSTNINIYILLIYFDVNIIYTGTLIDKLSTTIIIISL